MTSLIMVVKGGRWRAKEGRYHSTQRRSQVSQPRIDDYQGKEVRIGAEPNQEARVSNNISLRERKTILNEWTAQPFCPSSRGPCGSVVMDLQILWK
jgi:hypothetical protein